MENSNGKNGDLNDRPLFMQNGNRRCSGEDATDIGSFRRALPQFIAVSVKNILLFGYGMTLGFPTIVIPAIQGGEGREPSDIVLNRDEISWFSSINLICVPLGCLFSGLLTQPIGKRRAMQVVNLPILASWLLFHFATRTEHLYAALCLSGIGGGLMEAPVLTYVAEITEPKYRGILSALGSTCVITGVFIQFIFGSLLDWRTIAAVSSAFPVICIIALCFIPESPHWLIREQRFREAIKALQWLRGWVPEHRIESEFNKLYDDLITKPALEEAAEFGNAKPSKCISRLRLFRKRSFLVPFLLVAYTFFVGHFSGKTTLQTYAVQIFHTLKAPINKYHATILLGVAELVATILCVLLIHFTGKRPLVFISTLGVSICLFGTATYAHYLKIVPGFAINNVVAQAAESIVPKDNIISQDNITSIFQHEKSALQLTAELGMPDKSDVIKMDTSTASEALALTAALSAATSTVPNTVYWNRSNSENATENLSFIDLAALDYDEKNNSRNESTPLLELLDSEENVRGEENDILRKFDSKLLSKNITKEHNSDEKVPLREVVNEILLDVPKQEKNNLVWLPLILLLGSAFFAHMGIRMIPWILIGEVFPAPVRSTASGLVSGIGYIFGFLANKLFLQMLSTFTMPGTYWFYSAVALTGTIALYFILPETEGRTLAEIEAHFSKKSDVNLLRKAKSKKSNGNSTIPMDNIQNLRIPMSSQTEAKVIQLKQSDINPPRKGETNLAFDGNSTTHL